MTDPLVLWKEFPEINMKASFKGMVEYGHGNLGCHTGIMTGISFYTGAKPSAGRDYKWLQYINNNKGEMQYQRKYSYGIYHPDQKEVKKFFDYLLEKNFSFEDDKEIFYKHVIEQARAIPIWVIGDVINVGSKVRFMPDYSLGIVERYDLADDTYKILVRPNDFVDYLIRNKIGYIMESPVVQNPAHRTADNYSLNQVFFWIHPDHFSRTLNMSAEHGADALPTEDEWRNTISLDLQALLAKRSFFSPPKIYEAPTASEVTDVVFRPGQYRDYRFNRAKEL
jgi:hypothetical protein